MHRPHGSLRRFAPALALAFATLAGASRTLAQNAPSAADSAQRRVLMDQAAHASDGGDHARAIDLAERAGQIQMSPSLHLFLAQEQSAINRVVAALGNAQLCVSDAERDTSLHNRTTILSQCRALMSTLRGRVALVTVHTPSPAPAGMTVTVGGAVLPAAMYGLPYAVDPGAIAVEVSAPGRETFRQSVTAASGASSDVNVTLAEQPAAATNTTATNTTSPNTTTGAGTSGGSAAGGTASSSSGATTTTSGTAPTGEGSQTATQQGATHDANATSGTTSATPSGTSGASTATTSTEPAHTEPVTPLRHEEPAHSGGGIPIPAVVIAAVGLVGGGVFTTLGFLAQSDDLSHCPPENGVYVCNTDHAASVVKTDNLIGNLGLIGGSVLLVGGLAWIAVSQLGGHPDQPAHASRRVRVRPMAAFAPTNGGGIVTVGFSL